MSLNIKPFDVAEYLIDEQHIESYLEAAFEEGDPALISAAIGDIARARNMSAIAKESGLTRETIYRAFSKDGNPTLSTLSAVVKALGFQLSIKPIA